MKRIFVAVLFDNDTKRAISKVKSSIKKSAESGKFHKEENFHLTIEFIGMMPEKLLESLWQSIEESIVGLTSFTVSLDHLGFFEKRNKKIPWIGMNEINKLEEIQQKVVHAVANVLDHPTIHKYTPHITLGRQVVIKALPRMENAINVKVTQIALMESTSITGELCYKPLFVHTMNDK